MEERKYPTSKSPKLPHIPNHINCPTFKNYTFTPDKMKSFCEKHPNSLIAFRGKELTPQQLNALRQQVLLKKKKVDTQDTRPVNNT